MKILTSKLCRVAALTGFTAAIVGLSSCSSKNDQAAQMAAMQNQAPELAVLTLERGTSDLSNAYAATIKGQVDVDVRPLVSGFITRVMCDEGQYVKKGQTLFVLDQVTFQAAVSQAQAAVNSAQTNVNSMKLTADNKKFLFEKNIISNYEYQLALDNLAAAQSQLASAQAALTSAKKNLSYTQVTAPVSGYIGTIPNREGTLASPQMAQPLTTISDNAEVYAYFSLTEKDILALTGQGRSLAQAIADMPPVELRLSDGSIYPLKGKVATVSGVIDRTTGAASVRARFANPNRCAPLGQHRPDTDPPHREGCADDTPARHLRGAGPSLRVCAQRLQQDRACGHHRVAPRRRPELCGHLGSERRRPRGCGGCRLESAPRHGDQARGLCREAGAAGRHGGSARRRRSPEGREITAGPAKIAKIAATAMIANSQFIQLPLKKQ